MDPPRTVAGLQSNIWTLHRENAALRKEVETLRAQLAASEATRLENDGMAEYWRVRCAYG